MKPILHNVMAGIFLVLFLAACEEQASPPPASTSEPDLVRESDDAEKELVLLEALRQAEALEQPDSALAEALHDVGELYRVPGGLGCGRTLFLEGTSRMGDLGRGHGSPHGHHLKQPGVGL